jgi:hypothetical protein
MRQSPRPGTVEAGVDQDGEVVECLHCAGIQLLKKKSTPVTLVESCFASDTAFMIVSY